MYLDKRSFILAASLIISAGAAFPKPLPRTTRRSTSATSVAAASLLR